MISSYDTWNHIATKDLPTVVDYVITKGTIESITYDPILVDIIDWTTDGLCILDFGCGVGRNIIPLALKFPKVKFYGYDTTNMLKKTQQYAKAVYGVDLVDIFNLRITDSWNKIQTLRYQYVYATLVFQHIHENELISYLSDIKHITDYLLVYGRRFNDEILSNGLYKNTWQILEKCNLIPINKDTINYSVDGNDEEHTGFCIYKF